MGNSKHFVFILLLCFSFFMGKSQINGVDQILGSTETYNTAVPFLTQSNDARSSGMGDCGVSTSTYLNSIFFNPAKIAFAEKKNGVSITYTPWLRSSALELFLLNVATYHKLNNRSGLAFSMHYLSLGKTEFNKDFGASLGDQKPNELSINAAYSIKLSKKFSLGTTIRGIYSNLVPNLPSIGSITVKPGAAIAGDIAAFYRNEKSVLGHYSKLGIGASIQNIGTKISYTNSENQNLLPAMLRLGVSYEIELAPNHFITTVSEITRLLVPVIPYSKLNRYSFCRVIGGSTVTPHTDYVVDDDSKVFEGIVQSFHDSPDGFVGEIKEFNWSLGLEYSFKRQYFFRTGYFHETVSKGNRRYFTFGTGIKYKNLEFNFSYLLPQVSDSPLKNTYKLGLNLEFDAIAKKLNLL